MKGKLINKDQKWIVQYEEVDNTSFGIAAATGGAIIPSVKELPLHPDNLEQERYFIINENVKFEIVEETLSNLDGDIRKDYKFAKLIQPKEEVSEEAKQRTKNLYTPSHKKYIEKEYLEPIDVNKELPNKDGYYFIENLNDLATSKLYFSLQTLRWYYDSAMYDEAEENFKIWYKPVLLL